MRGEYDFSSPFMKATIVKDPGADEERFPLWVNGDLSDPTTLKPWKLTGYSGAQKAPDPVFAGSLAFLSSLTLSMDLGQVPTIELTLTPPLDEGRKFLDSTLIEYAVAALEVEFGYSTGFGGRVSSPPFQGILNPPTVEFGADMTITMKGVGTAGYYLSATSDSKVRTRRSREDHIKELAKELPGVNIARNKWSIDSNAEVALKEEVELVNAGKSYLHLISQLARQCGCWIRLADHDGFSDLVLTSHSVLVTQTPNALLAFYDFNLGAVGPSLAERGVFPILSVSVDSQEAIFLSGWTKALRSADINKTSLETQTATTSPQDRTVSGSQGTDTGVRGPSNNLSSVVLPPAEENFEDPKRVLDMTADMLSSSSSVGLRLEIETIGIPRAFPGLMYQVTGLGKRIDGFYSCFGVRHSISGAGYSTSLTLIQNSQLMVQALLNKIEPRATNDAAALDQAVPPNNDLSAIVDGIPVSPQSQDGT